MRRKTLIPVLLTALFLLLPNGRGGAQSLSAGGLLSSKGSGVAVRSDRGKRLVDFSLAADFYGVLTHPDTPPGFRASFHYNPVFYQGDINAATRFRLYAGPGATLGWAADRPAGDFGLAAALSGDFGITFDFVRHVSVALSASADLGVHLSRTNGRTLVNPYRNGLIRVFFPECRILYRFGEEKRQFETENSLKSITYGTETGIYAIFVSVFDTDFRVEDGYRVHDQHVDWQPRVCGEFLIHAGYNLNPFFNLSVYTGYAGEYRDTRMIPVSLRITASDSRRSGGLTGFADAGATFNASFEGAPGFVGKIGLGYRIRLGERCRLDFIAAGRASWIHPVLYDPQNGHRVAPEYIFRNNVSVFSAGFGVALSL